mmetsp:Transcript_47715/g.91173  ORF Transcript_47715/g.91173 Transcript_47715/m.91173 type:complete len:303 (+) Transcript_47715:196-1104(+)
MLFASKALQLPVLGILRNTLSCDNGMPHRCNTFHTFKALSCSTSRQRPQLVKPFNSQHCKPRGSRTQAPLRASKKPREVKRNTNCCEDLYVKKRLERAEHKNYRSAGIIIYHVGDLENQDSSSEEVHLLVAMTAADYYKRSRGMKSRAVGENALTILGGKRVARERHALHTASREAHEETLGLLHLEDDGHAKPTAVCWNPVAKYAVFLQEALPQDLALPQRYEHRFREYEAKIRDQPSDQAMPHAEVSQLIWISLSTLLSDESPRQHPYILAPLVRNENYSLLTEFFRELASKKGEPDLHT